MTRAVVIVNPLSGKGRYEPQIRAHAALATDHLHTHGIDATIRVTEAAGDARRFAGAAREAGVDLVIAWGGDGTVNEVASALAHGPVPLAIVPAGSGNGLAWDLGLPFSAAAALDVAATGADLRIDAGQIDDSLFFNIAGIGVDALIAARFAERGLNQRGPIGYLQLGLAELWRFRASEYCLTIDNERTDCRAMLIALANGRQYGNRVQIAPGARLDDGLLELVVVQQLSSVAIAMRLPSLFRGTLKPGRGITMRAVRELRIRSDKSIPFHVDGEPRVGPEELHVITLAQALTVRVPRA